MGDEAQTNVFLEPKFMLDWVVKTIDANVQVLSARIQRILGRAVRPDVDAKLLLIRGFAGRIRGKVSRDLEDLEATDEHAILLCSAARELLEFDR